MNSKLSQRPDRVAGPLLSISPWLSIALLLAATCPAGAESTAAKQWATYLNPLPQKHQYVNKSQDRVIKKKAFKAGEIVGLKPISNKETGIFAEISANALQDQSLQQKILEDSRTNGLSATLPWTLLEPSEEQYNWKPVDDLISLCKKNNKSLILRVSTCGLDSNETDSDTPAWVFADGVKSLTYQDKNHKERKMPIFWDNTYLAKWSNFVKVMGERYDKNPSIQSVGITGGGVLGSTQVVPDFLHEKLNYDKLETELTKTHGMSQSQLVSHWKYIADMFPRSFPNSCLNFDIDPPTPNRAGQDTLDEISDYLVFRYGQRVYLTRQNINNSKHGFEEYRVILKFKSDTFTGYKLTDNVEPADWKELARHALDDGASFVEIPEKYLQSDEPAIKEALDDLQKHLGFQLVLRSASVNAEAKSGDPLKASIVFINAGSTAPKAASRNLDKDVPTSYQVGFEIRDQTDKSLVLSVQTPPVSTTQWTSNKPISWQGSYRLGYLKPGEYKVFLSVSDKVTRRRLQIFDATEGGANRVETEIALGKLLIKE